MRILVASDSFKDGCSSIQACEAIGRGVQSANPDVYIDLCPISDGGEGTVEILQHHLGGELIEVEVSNPLFKRIWAHYLLTSNETAYIEMAQASGLELLELQERNPMNTSTFGTGELIKDALDRGCQKIIISVGGSATNELGIGMASALGWQFLDPSGNSLTPIGYNMKNVVKVDSSKRDHRIGETAFAVITDVNNPLFGPNGAARVFGMQKGGDAAAIEYLDLGMRHLWRLMNKNSLSAEKQGYGAAGGLGGGCVAFLDARIESGFAKIAELINLQDKVNQADIIITGEGHLDDQTADGKVICGICTLAKAQNKPVVAFCGKRNISDEAAAMLGVGEIIEINNHHSEAELEFLLAQTIYNLESRAKEWAHSTLLLSN